MQKQKAAHFKKKNYCVNTVQYHYTDKLGHRMGRIIESSPIAIVNSCIEASLAQVGNVK